MKQARTGLLVAIALLAVPAISNAAGNAAKPKQGAKPAPATAAATAPATGEENKPKVAQPGTEGAVEIDVDAPPTEAPKPAGTETPASTTASPGTETPSGEGGLGDICQIDPDACPKINMADAARRDLNPQMYAVQQIYALRARRVEIQPYWSTSMNDQYVSHNAPGIAINYYILNVLGIGANFNWFGGLNSDSSFNAETRRAVRVGVPLTEYQYSLAGNITYVPMYGKFAGFGDFIFHWDMYVVGGAGVISTRPIPVFDPMYRNFTFQPKFAGNVGLGIRVFFNRWIGAVIELRDYIYNEKLENMYNYDQDPNQITGTDKVAWRQNQANWYGNSQITNDVQLQVGITVFLPFSWEYRLPK